MTTCPHCKKHVKGHANGTKDFSELTKAEQIAAIGQATANLNKMRALFETGKHAEDNGDQIA